MDIINRYSGGIVFHEEHLTREGELKLSLSTKANGKSQLPKNIVELAFREAEGAEELSTNTEYEGGCVRRGGVHTWYNYNKKNFIGTLFLDEVFSGDRNFEDMVKSVRPLDIKVKFVRNISGDRNVEDMVKSVRPLDVKVKLVRNIPVYVVSILSLIFLGFMFYYFSFKN